MAVVPTAASTVENRPAATVYDSAAGATPEAFGMAQANALGHLGTTVGAVGGELGGIAARLNYMSVVKTATEAANNSDANDLNVLFSGDNPFFGLKGDAAVQARQPTLDALKKNRDDVLATLTDPRAQEIYRAHAAQTLRNYSASVARHSMQEGLVAADTVGQSRIRLAGQTLFANRTDPGMIAQSLAAIKGQTDEWALRHGVDSAAAEAHFMEEASKALTPMILERGITDAAGAKALLDRFGSSLLPTARVQIEEHLRPKIVAQGANAAIEQDMMAVTGGPQNTGTFSDNVRVESQNRQFDKNGNVLTSSAGALGISQIMPGTAMETANKHGIPFDAERVKTDTEYNLLLGKLYHADLMDKYGGSKLLADAAYNGGPKRVDDWLKPPSQGGLGDPRKGEISFADWAKKIPLDETRDYVIKTGSASGLNGPAATPSYPDWAKMQTAIIERTAGDPEMQAAQLSRLSQKRTLFDAQIAGDRSKMDRQFDDLRTALEAGRDDTGIPALDLRRIYPAAVAEDKIAQLTEARDFGQVAKAVQWASPDDLMKLRDALFTGQGDLALFPRLLGKNVTLGTGGGEGGDVATAALRQRHMARLDALIARRTEALKADPAAYVGGAPVVQEALKSGDPIAYMEASKAEQLRLGVGQYDTRALANSEVKKIVDELHNVDPEKADMRRELQGLATKYGLAWPDVLRDLTKHGLSPQYRMLADMDMLTQAVPSADLQRALKMRAEQKGEFGGKEDHAEKLAMADALSAALAPYAKTFANGGVEVMTSVISPAAVTLGTYYLSQGIRGAEAAKKAVEGLLGAKYEVDGPLRVAKGPNGESRIGAVRQAGAGFQQRLTLNDVAALPSLNPALNEADRRGAALRSAQNGFWAAGPDGKTVVLYGEVPGGVAAIPKQGGGFFTMDVNNLPKPGDPVVGPAETGGIQYQQTDGSWWGKLYSTITGAPEAPPQVGDANLHQFPTAADAKAALENGFDYGTGNEALMAGDIARVTSFKGKPVSGADLGLEGALDPRNNTLTKGTPQTAELYATAQLAVRRSPIAAIGFDPGMASLDVSGEKLNMGGAHDPQTGQIWSSARTKSNLVHESIHAGLTKLRKTGLVPKEVWDRLPKKEEDLVRFVMATSMGDPEAGSGAIGDQQRKAGLGAFGYSADKKDDPYINMGSISEARRAALAQLNQIAADYFAKSMRAGGPR